MKSAGESYVTHVESFQVDQGSVLGTYQDARGARVEKRARIDLLDLKEQREGEGHFFFKSKVVRGKFFYANPQPVKYMRLNHFLKVDDPPDAEVDKLMKSFEQFNKLAVNGVEFINVETSNEEVEKVSQVFHDNTNSTPLDCSITALHKFITKTDIPAGFFAETAANVEVDNLNIFMPLRLSDHLVNLVMTDNLEQFRKPILSRADSRDQIEYIQRLCGKSGQQAMNIAIELVGDMEKGTQYPPEVKPTTDGAMLAQGVQELIQAISLKKKEAADKSAKDTPPA
jgi:intracellular multiplication protein IcmO